VRGAALRTINALHTGLLVDDHWWPPTCAAKRATHYLRNTIQLDYHRISINEVRHIWPARGKSAPNQAA
jgi:hypothetical protein